MKILRAYKTRLNPNKSQAQKFVQYAGAARFVFNWALNDRIEKYKTGTPTNLYEQKKRFNFIKRDFAPWILEIPYSIQEEAFRNLDKAYQNFFSRVKKGAEPGFPRFKSKKRGLGSFTFRGCICVECKKIKLPVIGWIGLAEKDYLPIKDVKILKATINHQGEYWLISLQIEQEIPDPIQPAGKPIGIDVGIKSLAVCSNHKTFDNPRILSKYEGKLKRLNRELSRRKLGGMNRQKTKIKLSRLHYKIACVRKTTLHEISRYATVKTKPRIVVMENLNVAGMMKNHRLAKAIADASFTELKRQFVYKAAWNGIEFILADRWMPSSKTCSRCGSVRSILKLSERIYKCDQCGLVIDRDYNAAINLAAIVEGRNAPGLSRELECSNALL